MTPQFRSAIPQDQNTIIEFQVSMARETEGLELNRDVCTKGVTAVFEKPELGRYFVCEMDGLVVGSLMILTEWSDWRNGMVWWIHSLYILPEYRGQKLFSRFFAYIQNLAKSDGHVRGLRLYVDKTNAKARAVYESLGMNGDHYLTYELMW